MFCMTCGAKKTLKAPVASALSALEEEARDKGTFNFSRTVGFCTPTCATKSLASHIISSGGEGFFCSVCGKTIGNGCSC